MLSKYFGIAIALCGLGSCIYGLVIFVAMPAAAVVVAMIGLILCNVGGRKYLAADRKLNGKRKKENPEEHTFSKPYRVLAVILFFAGTLLVGVILPSRESLGILWWVLMFILSCAYTTIVLFFCSNTISIIFAVALTWTAIVMIARS